MFFPCFFLAVQSFVRQLGSSPFQSELYPSLPGKINKLYSYFQDYYIAVSLLPLTQDISSLLLQMYISEDYCGNIQLKSHRQVYGQKTVNNKLQTVCRRTSRILSNR